MSRGSPRKGFSLVELSIVLVILGLLTGGILAGQSLIRAAELRAVVTEYHRYIAASQTFRSRYLALPGDMPNATKFWGMAASGADCRDTSTYDQRTCDGDGNGIMYVTPSATSDEKFRFWQQLANAGLIEGSYSGIYWYISGDPSQWDNAEPGVNIPASKLSKGAWAMRYLDNSTDYDTSFYAIDYGNMLIFSNSDRMHYPPYIPARDKGILTPAEAWNIDLKLDDGKPASGKLAAASYNDICASADNGTSTRDNLAASYRLSDTGNNCALLFRHAF